MHDPDVLTATITWAAAIARGTSSHH